jgi:uncharacterized membrane protein YjgN (DUF898 family)
LRVNILAGFPAGRRDNNYKAIKGDSMSEPSAAIDQVREIPLEFRGSGGEYFRIWIVNLLLTIVTLGIYSAWAKVRRLRYFYGSTELDGSSFEYHGTPIAILKGRLIAVAAYAVIAILGQLSPVTAILFAPLVIFGVPWIIMRARLFQMRMSSWRGLRFNFHGNYSGALGAFVGWPILAVLTIGILWPLALWKQVKYLLGNTAYGTQRFGFLSTSGTFYRFCLIALAIVVGAIVAVAILAAVIFGVSGIGQQLFGAGNNPQDLVRVMFSAAVLQLLFLYAVAYMLVSAYFRANMLNASIGGVVVGPHRLYSRLKVAPLMWILLTNLVGMIVTLGLFYPWAKVRTVRYQLANTGVTATGDLGQFVTAAKEGTSALGEEVSEVFDIDFGF